MQGRGMKLMVLIGLLMLALSSGLGVAPAQASSPNPQPDVFKTVNIQNVDSTPIHVPCALGGMGEDVVLSGNQIATLRVVSYPNGSHLMALRIRFDKVTGQGQTSGEAYRAISTELSIERGVSPFPVDIVYQIQYKLRGLTSGTRLLVYERVKQSFDVAGNTTFNSQVDRMSCTTV